MPKVKSLLICDVIISLMQGSLASCSLMGIPTHPLSTSEGRKIEGRGLVIAVPTMNVVNTSNGIAIMLWGRLGSGACIAVPWYETDMFLNNL